MAILEFDRFEAWIRDRSRGCCDSGEIDELVRGEFDIDGTGEFSFADTSVQMQWEAWSAALVDTAPKWIAIKNKPPPPNTCVFLTDGKVAFIGQLSTSEEGEVWSTVGYSPEWTIHEKEWDGWDCEQTDGIPTHWHPFPDPLDAGKDTK